jgi:oxygen-independent coproporphyrinogen-3 oxidase
MIPEDLTTIIKKYEGKIPRYTSYPTAAELTPAENHQIVVGKIRENLAHPISLYIHLPFCASLCWFCACNKVVSHDRSVVGPYLQALKKEIFILSRETGTTIKLGQIHLGGGSPTYFSDRELESLLQLLQQEMDGFHKASKSIELDPRTTTDAQITILAKYGFERASLGVQDFDPKVQEAVHRIQPKGMVAELVKKLREANFKSINFDLIYGLPGQSTTSITDTITSVIEMAPDRIALYGYAHVQWKIKVQKVLEKSTLPSAEERIELFAKAEEMLLDRGYLALGLDHFALPNDELVYHAEARTLHRTFMGYTTVNGEGTIGLGVSAISDIGGVLYQNECDLDAYYQKLADNTLPIARSKERNHQDTVRAFVIERIMCDGELSLEHTPDELRGDVHEVLDETRVNLNQLERDGLIVQKKEGFAATFYGRFFLRNIAAQFDQYLLKTTGGFSQAV